MNNLIFTRNTYNQSINSSTDFYITQVVDGCESNPGLLSVVIHPKPNPPSGNDAGPYCAGTTVPPLTVSGNTGANFEWYDDINLNNLISTSNSFTGNNQSSQTYYVIQTDNNCSSDALEIDLFINPVPSTPTSSNTTYLVCEGTIGPTVSVSGDNNAQFSWYSDATQTNQIATGNSFNPGIINNSINLYVSQSVNDCESDNLLSEIDMQETPELINVDDLVVNCTNTNNIPPFIANNGTGNINWYADAALNNLLFTGNSFSSNANNSTTFYIQEEINGCTGPVSEAAITFTNPPIPPNTNDALSDCDGSNIPPMTANSNYGGVLNWYSDATLSNLVFTGISYNPGISNSATFYVTETINGCESNGAPVSVVINNAPNPVNTIDFYQYCEDENPQTISINPAQGNSINWYGDAQATNLIFTGNNFTPSINLSTSYYVSEGNGTCESELFEVEIEYILKPIFSLSDIGPYCEGSSIPPVFTGSNADLIEWYSDVSLNNLIFSGEGFIPSNSNSGIYYVIASNSGCSSETEDFFVEIISQPDAPQFFQNTYTYCEGESINSLDVLNTSGTVHWFTDQNLQNLVHTGINYTPSINFTTTYYVIQVENGCESNLTDVNVEINPLPVLSLNGLPSIISNGTPLSLNISPSGGTLAGPGIVFNAFNPSLAGPGLHEITYSYTDSEGCTNTITDQTLVVTLNFNFVNYNLGTISPE